MTRRIPLLLLGLALGTLVGWWALALVMALIHGASGAGHQLRHGTR